MISQEYCEKLTGLLKSFDKKTKAHFFIFGSATRKKRFNDVDIGILTDKEDTVDIFALKEYMDRTTFPFFVDIIDFNSAVRGFRDYVFDNEKIVWLT